MKTFKGEFDKFKEKIATKESFALSRCNDGEMIILNNEYINLLHKCNGEFIYDPKNPQHGIFRTRLLNSATHRDSDYYVGIACSCCVGKEKHLKLKAITNLPESNLTFGNIFVNGNYPRYVNEILPLFGENNVVIICNHKAKIEGLPFAKNVVKRFDVSTNAWMENHGVVDDIKKYILDNGIKKHLFLFAAGPFSNILIHELYQTSKENSYIDIGSTLDSMMNLGATRGYLQGANTLTKTCEW